MSSNTEHQTSTKSKWWPQRDSNPCFSLERAVSWASRRWGRARSLAGGGGFEPPLRGPEPRVLPLDDPPPALKRGYNLTTKPRHAQPAQRMAFLRLRLGRNT